MASQLVEHAPSVVLNTLVVGDMTPQKDVYKKKSAFIS